MIHQLTVHRAINFANRRETWVKAGSEPGAD
jgi:hypothetical protein